MISRMKPLVLYQSRPIYWHLLQYLTVDQCKYCKEYSLGGLKQLRGWRHVSRKFWSFTLSIRPVFILPSFSLLWVVILISWISLMESKGWSTSLHECWLLAQICCLSNNSIRTFAKFHVGGFSHHIRPNTIPYTFSMARNMRSFQKLIKDCWWQPWHWQQIA